MGMMKLEIPHTLPVEDAKTRVQALLEYWTRKHGIKTSWAGEKATFSGKVMGIAFDGHFTVTPKGIAGEASDPGFLFRSKAKEYLEKKFGTYLDPKKTLAQLAAHDND